MGRYVDLTGARHGRLTVIREVERPPGITQRHYWLCKCDCGKELVLQSGDLSNPKRVSCGCYKREMSSKVNYERHLTHGMSKSRLYGVWNSIKSRCTNPNCKEYRFYGGRGITICDEWKIDFPAFRKWAVENGYDDNALRGECTIDRIDVNGNYEPSNCRWVDMKTQITNMRERANKYVFRGECHSLREWADIVGMNLATLKSRLNCGWEIERALTEAVHYKNKSKGSEAQKCP